MAVTFPIRANTQPAVKDIDGLIAALRKTGKEAGMSEKEINDMVNAAKKAGTDGVSGVSKMNQSLGGLNSTISKVGAGFAALFALDRLKAFVESVVDITSQFQRLEAVLTNTLGSNSAARAAMKDLADFAAKTPFSLITLTENFVKLANRGVKPTMDQLRGLGDLSATLGKDIGQLVEALLDVNNPERWKELGIVSQTVGDKVKLSFRGVTYEADRTVEGVTKAAVALGNLEGVAGSMAAISETLGGKISNLSDSWDRFLATIGDGNKGVLSGAASLLTQAVDKARELLQTDSQKREDQQLGVYIEQKKIIEEIFAQTQDIDKAREQALARLYVQLEQINKQIESGDAFIKQRNSVPFGEKADPTLVNAAFRAATERNALVNKYNDLINDGQKAILEYTKEVEKKQEVESGYAAKVKEDEKLKAQEAEKKRLESIADEYRKLRALTDSYADAALAAYNRALIVNPNELKNIGSADGFSVDLPEVETTSDEGLKTLADIEAQKQQLRQDTFDHALGLANDLFKASMAINQQELGMLQYRYQQEIMMAGDNQDAKDKITRDYQKKQYEIQNKQMKLQSEQAIFQILSSQGPAIAKTIGEGGAFALPLALSLIGVFGALIASQRKLQPPRFAAGGAYDIDGPGTETSDSIPFFLSKHETVAPAHATKRFGELLKPMLEPSFDWAGVKSIVDRKLPSSPAAAIIVNSGLSEKEYGDKLDRIEKAITNKRETSFHFDENGFGLWMGRGQEWTKYVKSRYSM